MKKLLKSLIRRLRSRAKRSSLMEQPYGQMAARDRFIDIKAKLATESPVIVDGGANSGWIIASFLNQYRFPTIHAFEPIPELVAQLQQRFATYENVIIHGVAIGAESKMINFNVVNNLVSSSVFNPSALNKSYHGENMGIRQVLEVQQVRLEEALERNAIVDLLKLDLQGYELEALKGCGTLLERIRIITVEVEFVPLYDGQPLFGDIDVFLRASGFRLLNLYELYTHPDAQLTSGDAVYLNSRYF